MPTEAEILTKVREKEESLQLLYNRMDEDYDLWRLKPYVPEKEKDESYTSNAPRTYGDKILSTIAGATVKFIVLWDEKLNNREQSSMVERLLRGIFHMNDLRLKNMMQPNLLKQLAFYTAIRGGWLMCRALVNKYATGPKMGQTYFDILPCDPRSSFFDVGPDGLLWAGYRRYAKRGQLEREYRTLIDFGNEKDDLAVIDYWDEEINAVILDGTSTMSGGVTAIPLKPPTPHGLGHVPFCRAPIGFQPMAVRYAGESVGDTVKDFGETIYKANRDIYESINETISWRKDIVKQYRKPNLVTVSPSGDAIVEEQDMQGPGGHILHFRTGEDIKTVFEPHMPPDVNPLQGLLIGEEQRGALPTTTYGNMPSPISGYATKLLNAPLQTILDHCIKPIEDVVMAVSHELLEQYSSGGFLPAQIRGYDERGQMFQLVPKPEEVTGDWFITVTIAPDLPQDDMARMTVAEMAKRSQILANDTIAEDILEVPDIDQERKRRDNDFIEQIPSIKLNRLGQMLMADAQKAFMNGDYQTAMQQIGEARLIGMELMKLMPPPMMMGMGGPGGGGPPPMPGGGMMGPPGPEPRPEVAGSPTVNPEQIQNERLRRANLVRG